MVEWPRDWCDGIEVVAMDGLSGFETAAGEELPDAVEVMDPFHVVKLAGDALDDVHRRILQETTGDRGRVRDPMYRAKWTLHKGSDRLTRRQQERIAKRFANANLAEVELTWAVYQYIVAAYRAEDRSEGKRLVQAVIDVLSSGLSVGLVELRGLGWTLKRRAADVLAFFTRPGTSNRSHRSRQRQDRASARVGARIPQPHALHREMLVGSRWIQAGSTLVFTMSRSNIVKLMCLNSSRTWGPGG